MACVVRHAGESRAWVRQVDQGRAVRILDSRQVITTHTIFLGSHRVPVCRPTRPRFYTAPPWLPPIFISWGASMPVKWISFRQKTRSLSPRPLIRYPEFTQQGEPI